MSLVVTSPPGLSIRTITAFTAWSASASLSFSTSATTWDSRLASRDSSWSLVSSPWTSMSAIFPSACSSPSTTFSPYFPCRPARSTSTLMQPDRSAKAARITRVFMESPRLKRSPLDDTRDSFRAPLPLPAGLALAEQLQGLRKGVEGIRVAVGVDQLCPLLGVVDLGGSLPHARDQLVDPAFEGRRDALHAAHRRHQGAGGDAAVVVEAAVDDHRRLFEIEKSGSLSRLDLLPGLNGSHAVLELRRGAAAAPSGLVLDPSELAGAPEPEEKLDIGQPGRDRRQVEDGRIVGSRRHGIQRDDVPARQELLEDFLLFGRRAEPLDLGHL